MWSSVLSGRGNDAESKRAGDDGCRMAQRSSAKAGVMGASIRSSDERASLWMAGVASVLSMSVFVRLIRSDTIVFSEYTSSYDAVTDRIVDCRARHSAESASHRTSCSPSIDSTCFDRFSSFSLAGSSLSAESPAFKTTSYSRPSQQETPENNTSSQFSTSLTGAWKIMWARVASEPCFAMVPVGSTPLFLDLDILA